jgi:hypothetical protein
VYHCEEEWGFITGKLNALKVIQWKPSPLTVGGVKSVDSHGGQDHRRSPRETAILNMTGKLGRRRVFVSGCYGYSHATNRLYGTNRRWSVNACEEGNCKFQEDGSQENSIKKRLKHKKITLNICKS